MKKIFFVLMTICAVNLSASEENVDAYTKGASILLSAIDSFANENNSTVINAALKGKTIDICKKGEFCNSLEIVIGALYDNSAIAGEELTFLGENCESIEELENSVYDALLDETEDLSACELTLEKARYGIDWYIYMNKYTAETGFEQKVLDAKRKTVEFLEKLNEKSSDWLDENSEKVEKAIEKVYVKGCTLGAWIKETWYELTKTDDEDPDEI